MTPNWDSELIDCRTGQHPEYIHSEGSQTILRNAAFSLETIHGSWGRTFFPA
jgi:hypothetical protein